MGLFDKLMKPKTINSGPYGKVIAFVSEEKLPNDLVELNKMGMYYVKPYNGQKPEYDKAFLINRKLVQLDIEKKFMEARRRLGDLYADGQGTARDLAAGNALRNEWYSDTFLHCEGVYNLGLQLVACLERHCMSLQQMMMLAYDRLKLDWENYATPVGAVMLDFLLPMWKDRDMLDTRGWTNQQYCRYLYDTYHDPNMLYALSQFEKDYEQAERMVYQAADAGSLLAVSMITNLKLAYKREEAEMKRLLEYRAKEDKLMLELQEKSNLWTGMELEALIK